MRYSHATKGENPAWIKLSGKRTGKRITPFPCLFFEAKRQMGVREGWS